MVNCVLFVPFVRITEQIGGTCHMWRGYNDSDNNNNYYVKDCEDEVLCCSKTLKGFREGEIQVLVSSDAMTRGMDVEGVKNVINYDMPMYIKTYIHRAGRTARAGQAGRCFTLLSKDEVYVVLLIRIWLQYCCISMRLLGNVLIYFENLFLWILYILDVSVSKVASCWPSVSIK